MQFEEEYIETNGIRLHVMLAGPKDGKPVILLHGFPEFWYGWHKQMTALAEAGFRVIVPDQRGYNLSEKPKGVRSYSLKELTADILGLIDALGYDKVYLAGHDWGAAVAWMLAVWHPERFHKLAILNVPHPKVMSDTVRRDPRQMLKSWYIGFFQLPWIPEAVLGGNHSSGLGRLLRSSGHAHSFEPADLAEYRTAWSQPGALSGMGNWYRAILRYPPDMPENPRVRIPTLMIWGVQDVALARWMARPSIDYCDDGQLIFFEDATHWVQHDRAAEVSALLVDFFK
jgi:pimeloyl-ACP methyl ester carboxylesterase